MAEKTHPSEVPRPSAPPSQKAGTRLRVWAVAEFALFGILLALVLQPCIQATIVHGSVAGTIFQITSYVAGLDELYAPWLPLMVEGETGERTATLLTVGTNALRALCACAVIGLALIVVSAGLGFAGMHMPCRVCAVVGFAFEALVALACIAIVALVQAEMSSDVISINVLGVRPSCYAQLALAVAGIVAAFPLTGRAGASASRRTATQGEEG